MIELVLSGGLRKNLFHPSFLASCGCLQPLIFGFEMHNFYLCLHFHMAFLYISVSSPFLSLIRTLVIRFRAHPNQEWSYLKYLTLTISAKTYSKVTFWKFQWQHILGPQFNLQQLVSSRTRNSNTILFDFKISISYPLFYICLFTNSYV